MERKPNSVLLCGANLFVSYVLSTLQHPIARRGSFAVVAVTLGVCRVSKSHLGRGGHGQLMGPGAEEATIISVFQTVPVVHAC